MKSILRSILVIILGLVSVFVSSHHVSAQDGGTINYGETVESELSGAAKHQWTFVGAADDAVTISIVTTSLDPSLSLLDPNGDIIETSDNDGSSLSTELEVTLAADGIYAIVVTNNAADSSGTYSLTLGLTDDNSGETETIFETVDSLPAGESMTHTFTGNENDIVTIIVTSESFDATVTLFDSAGTELASDDDSGGHYNPFLVIGLPSDDEYTVEVGSYTGEEGGEYSVTVAVGLPAITLDSSLSGDFDRDSVAYVLESEESVSVSIAANSEDFDPIVTLVGENGEVLNLDDDSGGDFNALINSTLEENSTYFVVVRTFYEDGAGEYELIVSTISDSEVNVDVDVITYGETIQATADDTTPRYEFEGQEGDVITISLSSDEFDTLLELFDSNGTRLMANDDIDSDNLNSEIEITLPVDDVYQIVVSAFDPPPVGEFTLTLTLESPSEQ